MFYKIKFQVLEKTEKKYELEIHDSIDHFILSRPMGIAYDKFGYFLSYQFKYILTEHNILK